jgi:arsenate reductase-like glutaredoxin family protein
LDAKKVAIKEEVPASRKLSAADAKEIAKGSSKVYVAKGKKLDVFDMKSAAVSEVVEKMLGPTGNLRAPTLRVGKTTVVGFNEETFDAVLG